MNCSTFKRALCSLLAFVMVFGMLPVSAFAEAYTGGPCPHHTEHTDCGYTEGSEASPCGHVCDDACWLTETLCVHLCGDGSCAYAPAVEGFPCLHEHDEFCGYTEPVAEIPCTCLPGEDGTAVCDGSCGAAPGYEGTACEHYCDGSCGFAEPAAEIPCDHVCSVESGCVVAVHDCVHTFHDGSCGYVEAVPAAGCGYVCGFCLAASGAFGDESEPDEPDNGNPVPDAPAPEGDLVAPETGADPVPDEEELASIPSTAHFIPIGFDGTFNGLPARVTEEGELLLNEFNFPDNNFLSFITEKCQAYGFVITVEQAAAITEINCSDMGINSLKGAEFFTSLTELNCSYNELTILDLSTFTDLTTLDCHSNYLTELDVSCNSSLESLTCYGNELTSLELGSCDELLLLECMDTNLTALDLSGAPALTELNCNDTAMTALDLSVNIALEKLYCNYNALTSLDLSANTALTELDCSYNALTELDLSANTTLTKLNCSNTALTALDLSANTALDQLYCSATALTELDLSANTALRHLEINGNDLTEIDLSKNTSLVFLVCESNALTSLDLSANTNLDVIMCDGQSASATGKLYGVSGCAVDMAQLVGAENLGRVTVTTEGVSYDSATGIAILPGSELAYTYDTGHGSKTMTVTLNVSPEQAVNGTFNGSPAQLDSFGKLLINEANFPDDNFRAFISENYDEYDIEALSAEQVAEITVITCLELNISDLSGIEYFTALTSLDCGINDLAELDLRANTTLVNLGCSSNILTKLDLSANTALENLYCNYNALTSLDLSACTSLEYLCCNSNSFTSLDLSANVKLEYIDCEYNALTSLDLSTNTALKKLYCSNNSLAALDLSANTALESLYCSDNSLAALDLSANTALENLYCQKAGLTSLDLSANTALKNLYCSNNSLAALDLSANTALVKLSCSKNALTSLDLSANTKLSDVVCDDQSASVTGKLYGTYGCAVDMAELVGAENLDRVSITTRGVSYDSTTGIAILPGSKLAYTYDTGCGSKALSVTLNVSPGQAVNGIFNGSPAQLDSFGKLLINEANFPDEDFRAFISEKYDEYDIEALSAAQVADITTIHCSSRNIADMSGIEYFTALTSLDCSHNDLTSLDLSANTALEILDCSSNSLTSLDLSANANLKYLTCNYNDLTSLDVSASTSLKYLCCYSNSLTSLDLSANTALETLTCSENSLATLDLSANANLAELDCSTNSLTALDLSANTALKNLECGSNSLTSLDLSANTALKNLECYSNSLTELDLSANTALVKLSCYKNALTSLDLSANTNLSNVVCDNQSASVAGKLYGVFSCAVDMAELVGVENLDRVSITTQGASYDSTTGIAILPGSKLAYTYDTGRGSKALSVTLKVSPGQTVSGTFNGSPAQLDGFGNLLINEANFPDDNFRAFISDSYDEYDIEALSAAQVAVITTIYCSSRNIADMSGIEYFTALTSLNCSSNSLTSLDLSANANLYYFDCNNNALTSLDVSASTSLEYLCCYSNSLTSLDLSANTALETLVCSDNPLATLDLSANTALEYLYCDSNSLASLDLSANANLAELCCSSNSLTSLDLSANTALKYLRCEEVALSSLDLSANTALESLLCSSNALSSLDLSANTALKNLKCGSNSLTGLDLSANVRLETLDLGTQLSTANAEWGVDAYVLDLGDILGNEALFSRVELDSGCDAVYDPETGLVTIPGHMPERSSFELVYTFDTNAPASVGSSAMKVSVTVELPIKPPASVEINGYADYTVGDTVCLMAGAEGSELSFQWQVKAKNSENWVNSGVLSARSETLSFTCSKLHDGYSYRCRVSNPAGTVYSDPVTLSVVNEAPYMLSEPTDIKVENGTKLLLDIEVHGVELTYQWQVQTADGRWVNSNVANAKKQDLSFYVNMSHDGLAYRCLISNDGGEIYSQAAVITVTDSKPVIVTQPEAAVLENGDTVALSVGAEGDDLTYRWQVMTADGRWVNSGISTAKEADLVFNVNLSHDGLVYRCRVSNSYGTVYSEPAGLTVTLKKPSITDESATAVLSPGDTATFSVTAEGDELSYQWLVKVPGTDKWVTSGISGSKTPTLRFRVSAAHDGYFYRCRVSNSAGTVYSEPVTLSVK